MDEPPFRMAEDIRLSPWYHGAEAPATPFQSVILK